MEIKNNFVSKNGIIYPNLREIAFTKDNIFGNLGTLVNETNREATDGFGKPSNTISEDGVYIYKSNYDEKTALRVYKCFLDPNFNGYRDEKLISRLQKVQDKIELTSFPVGIVTLDGNIIGQEIPYYEEHNQLYQVKDEVTLKELFMLYRQCLVILEELHKKGIYYLDIHAKNFLVNNDFDVQLIDFEPNLIRFNDKSQLKKELSNFYNMINLVNKRINIDIMYKKPETLDEAFHNLDKLEKKL